MRKIFALLGTAILLSVTACEQPASPDFKLQHRVQTPLVLNKQYKFLGEKGALIDTTSADFSSLFREGEGGVVVLSKQQDFEFGDLEDAIPEVSADPASINSEVGEIVLGDFSSQGEDGNVGSASFNDLTGLDESNFDEGDPLPDKTVSSPHEITLDTDYFVSATIKSGSLDIDITNRLGFEIDRIEVALLSDGIEVGDTEFNNVSHGEKANGNIVIPANTTLQNLSTEVDIFWENKTLDASPDEFVVNKMGGNNLVASEVEAVVPAQDFSSQGTSVFDDSDFQFGTADHYIELGGGELRITDLANNMDLDIELLRISFPGIRTTPYSAADSLVIVFSGSTKLTANTPSFPDHVTDLAAVRIYALGNEINYHITGLTEDTQEGAGSDTRTINETDNVTAAVEINDLTVEAAFGVIQPKEVLLNDDDPSNGTGVLDLFNDDEAELVDIDGIRQLSEQIEGIEFLDPLMSIVYESNLGLDNSIIAAIQGVSAGGNAVYLRGKAGAETHVESNEIPSSLQSNGSALASDQVIRFTLDRSEDGTHISGLQEFDNENSNVDEFLNNLPTQIRFIGTARLNDNAEEGLIVAPVQFAPAFSVDLPLHFQTETSSYSDTTSANLDGLPGDDSEQRVSEATLIIEYSNGLPFELNLELEMLDESRQFVTDVPLPTQDPLVISTAGVNQTTRFVETKSTGKMVMALDRDQLDVLNLTRHMIVKVNFNTFNNEDVKVRADDSITLSIRLNIAIESTVN